MRIACLLVTSVLLSPPLPIYNTLEIDICYKHIIGDGVWGYNATLESLLTKLQQHLFAKTQQAGT